MGRKPKSRELSKEPVSPGKPSTSSNKRAASPTKPTALNKRAAGRPRKVATSKSSDETSKFKLELSEDDEDEADPEETSSKRVARKRPARKVEETSVNDEKPAEKKRGRPTKAGRGRSKKTAVPVLVDKGTSP